MNTFLPSPDFDVCARVLDSKRLSRQISECMWLAEALVGKQTSMPINNHVALKLWRNYMTNEPLIGHLRRYQIAMGKQFRAMSEKGHAHIAQSRWMDSYPAQGNIHWPEEVHRSHRAVLIRKDPGYYTMALRGEGLPVDEEYEGTAWLSPSISMPQTGQ